MRSITDELAAQVCDFVASRVSDGGHITVYRPQIGPIDGAVMALYSAADAGVELPAELRVIANRVLADLDPETEADYVERLTDSLWRNSAAV